MNNCGQLFYSTFNENIFYMMHKRIRMYSKPKARFLGCLYILQRPKKNKTVANFYLPSITVTVTWFTEHEWSSCRLDKDSVSPGDLLRQNPGFFGWGIDAVSLLSINTTEDIDGRSSARSWTHKRPTCIHLNTSEAEYDSPADGSTISSPVPFFHSSQAWNNSTLGTSVMLSNVYVW